VQAAGQPNRSYGEELCAWIIPREGASLSEDEVREFCRGQIAHYEIWRYIEFVSSLPTTVTGKIQKYLIRNRMKDELRLDEERTA